MDMISSSIEGRGAPEEHMWENWVGHAVGGGLVGRVSLIWVAPGGRVMASENRSGIRPFTSSVGGDYTLIEVV